jgi:hypothetical protein
MFVPFGECHFAVASRFNYTRTGAERRPIGRYRMRGLLFVGAPLLCARSEAARVLADLLKLCSTIPACVNARKRASGF